MANPKKLYGKQTRLAVENFPISGWMIPSEVLLTLALIKQHAAKTNGALGIVKQKKTRAIIKAAKQVQEGIRDGSMREQFPIDVFQTGSGTSTNMNMNEVLATLASRKKLEVHPNDDVNTCQSSNDVIPTAIQLACILKAQEELVPSLTELSAALKKKAKQSKSVIKTARTHLMDAVPIRLGDEIKSYASLLDQCIVRINEAIRHLHHLPLGGTAAGTGLNAHPKFAKMTIYSLSRTLSVALYEAKDHVAAQSCPLALLALSSALRETATALHKIANDIRHLSSGPTAGLGEITLPSLQPGSSIMPGKVNPVLCESVMQVAMYVTGADATVQEALNRGSQFELNTAYPVAAQSLIMSMRLISNVAEAFNEKCIAGIEVNRDYLEQMAAKNPMLVTRLAPEIGYDEAAKIAKEAMEKQKTILEVALKKKLIPERKLRKLLDPGKMV